MKQMHLGAQLFTVRDYMKTPEDFRSTMRKMAEIGYKYVQVSGVNWNIITADVVAEAVKETGIKAFVTHTNADRLVAETEKVIEEHESFGCDNIGIGGAAPFDDIDGANRFIEIFTPVVEKIKAAGKKFLYHNHNWEFETKIGDGNVIDYFVANTDPEVFKFSFDAYWNYYAGNDTPADIRKYGDRIVLTHFKDMQIVDGKRLMTELLTGIIDYDAIMAACDDAGICWHFVEQDNVYMDAIESIKISHDNMKQRYNMD